MWTACGLDGDDTETVWALFYDWFCYWFWFLKFIRDFYDQENNGSNNKEVKDGLHECTPFDDCRSNGDGQSTEIHSAHHKADDRHEHIVDERCDDLAKGST